MSHHSVTHVTLYPIVCYELDLINLELHSVSFHYNISHTYLTNKPSLDLRHMKLFHKILVVNSESLKPKKHVLMDLAFALILWCMFEKKNIFWSQTTKLFKFNLKLRISFSEYLKCLSEKHC